MDRTFPCFNRRRVRQPLLLAALCTSALAIAQEGRSPRDHTTRGPLQGHGADQQVEEQGGNQGLDAKFAHEAGVHQSEEHPADHDAILSCSLRGERQKGQWVCPGGF